MPSPAQIREARHRAGLTQSQAAALVGVTDRTWRAWEMEADGVMRRNMPSSTWELFALKAMGMT